MRADAQQLFPYAGSLAHFQTSVKLLIHLNFHPAFAKCLLSFSQRVYIVLMDKEPNTENVHYIDEYPELKKMVWLRRLNQQRQLGTAVVHQFQLPTVVEIRRIHPDFQPPDGAA